MTTELKRVSLGESAANLTTIIERVASAGESIVVENEGQDVAVVNPAVPPASPEAFTQSAIGGRVASTRSSRVYEALKKRLDRPTHSGRASKNQCCRGANLSQ